MKAAVVLTYISSLKKKSTNLLNPLIDFLINTINNSHVIPPEKASACVENCVEVVCTCTTYGRIMEGDKKRAKQDLYPGSVGGKIQKQEDIKRITLW